MNDYLVQTEDLHLYFGYFEFEDNSTYYIDYLDYLSVMSY